MKITPILLALLLMLQGCTVYKGSISLEEAVSEEKKVKVTTTDSPKPFEFQRIEVVDGQYKGIPKRYDASGEKLLKKENILKIREHDKTASNIITFSPLAIILALGIILFSGSGNDGGG